MHPVVVFMNEDQNSVTHNLFLLLLCLFQGDMFRSFLDHPQAVQVFVKNNAYNYYIQSIIINTALSYIECIKF
jgi:hypothetical protein